MFTFKGMQVLNVSTLEDKIILFVKKVIDNTISYTTIELKNVFSI